jgi:hypothetical protein
VLESVALIRRAFRRRYCRRMQLLSGWDILDKLRWSGHLRISGRIWLEAKGG